ncbi:MAG: sigma-70 family RNA polymerase sigma factor [Candidatus Nealsonbacteria bacterium]|nr:sigma-70 family RNA polymerase sigma factor [Candidatus Nealsonbacteria bacterium]
MTATTIGDRRRWVLSVLDEYEVPLARFAGRLLGDLDAARDVVQHVFLRLCGQSEEEIGDRVAPWLFTVCRNRAIDVLRGRQRIESLSRGEAPGCQSRESDPAVTAEQNETYRRLNALVDELPLKHREVLGLWMEGLAYGRIAEVTGHSEGNVRVLVHRALKRLREHPDVQRLLDLPSPKLHV